MFRILFFILICTLGFYTFWGIYSPIKDVSEKQVSERYEEYLSGALSRSFENIPRYNVTFYKEDFIDIRGYESYFSQTDTFDYLDEVPYQERNGGTYVTTGSRPINGNFSLPAADFTSSLGGGNSDCSNGLIFDPCLILDDPEPASGGMYFGTDRI